MIGPLIDLSDDDLLKLIRREGGSVQQSYNGMVAELDRRAANRQARSSARLTRVVVVATVVNAAAAVVAALATVQGMR